MACEKFNIKSHELILGRFVHAANNPEPGGMVDKECNDKISDDETCHFLPR